MTLYAVNRNTGEAVYQQIARALEQEIKTAYDAGDYLPAEHDLAARFSVNRHTLRRAMDELIDKGLVERQHGRGTIVLNTLLNYPIAQQTRFTETFNSVGKMTGTAIIRKLLIPARGGVAKRLGVEVDAPVLMMETVRLVDGQPFCIVTHFLPSARFPEIETDYSGGSLHRFIEQHYQLALQRQESLVTAALPMGDDATLLQIPHSFPILRVKSVNIDAISRQPVEYSITRFRADRVQLSFVP
ncbi:MAG: phosphonate metabolism transcriptional regulator PhnF [Methylophaga sp.]